ncbi:MAG: WYL domain-containing protein [Cyclobacteriaceae bacterium]
MSRTLIRYWAYDSCLKNQTIKYSWKDLLTRANRDLEDRGYDPVKRTQFFKDISALKAPPYLAPIETFKEGRQSYYKYTDPGFSLRNQQLNEQEAQQIKSALMVLSRFKGMPQFDWVHEVIPKIEQNFGLGESSTEIIGFDENVDLKGLEYLGELFNAILYKKPLQIMYQSFRSSQPLAFNISPYFLKQYNNRWFLFAQDERYDSITTLSLDRIESVAPSNCAYVPNTLYDFNDYFEDIIGITRPDGARSTDVRLWFAPEQAPYVRTKPLHGTQRHQANDDGSMSVTIDVIPNYELEQLILSFGESCRVIEPEDLRKKIERRLNMSASSYSDN